MSNIAYIDGANLHKGSLELGWKLDYRRFRVWLTEKYSISTALIFIGKIPEYEDIYKNLEDAGFSLSFKKVQKGIGGRIKGNCDGELIVAAMSDFYEKHLSRSILVTSDGDFACLAGFLHSRNALLSIISPRNSCSYSLRSLNVSLTYLDTQRKNLEYIPPDKEKAPSEDLPSQGSLS